MDVKTTFLNVELDEKVDDMLIFSNDKVQVDLTKEFLSLKFSIKDMREVDVILGIRIKHKSNGIAISQSYYIEKGDWLPDVCHDLYKALYCFYSGKTEQVSKKQTCITSSTMEYEFVALVAAGKEAEWLRNLILEIPLCFKPITLISIICDSAATLAKAYSQIYNGKSRNLSVRHIMICKLIPNGVVSIEFVRSQQNLADHLMKGLARD
ncbi:zinc finger, CCHC-type containing protein [Tanacetum coccineum]